MRPLFLGAALAAVSAPAALAGNEADNDWLALDGQLGGLSSSASSQGPGVNVGAILRAAYAQSSDFLSASGDDLGGFVIDDARLFAEGNYGEFSWRLSTDFAEGAGGYNYRRGPDTIDFGDPTDPGDNVVSSGQTFEAELLDAYARWAFSEAFVVQIGQFNARDAFSGDVGQDRLLFQTRSFIGDRFNEFDLGVQVHGSYGNQQHPQYLWSFAALNGDDGAQNDLDLRARIDFNLVGDGGLMNEGAYGSESASTGTLGLFWAEDRNIDGAGNNGTAIGGDYRGTAGPIGYSFEYVEFDDYADTFVDANAGISGGLSTVSPGFGTADASIWSASASYLFGADMNWELGVRWEDLDSETDETRLTAGLAYYVSGHNIKWQLSYIDYDVDLGVVDPTELDAFLEANPDARGGEVFTLGLSIGLSAMAK